MAAVTGQDSCGAKIYLQNLIRQFSQNPLPGDVEQGELGQRMADRRRHRYRSSAVEVRDFESSRLLNRC